MSFEDVAWLYTHTSLSFTKSQGDDFSNLETEEAFQLIAYKFLDWVVFTAFFALYEEEFALYEGEEEKSLSIDEWFYHNQRSDISNLLLLMDHKRGHRVGLKTIKQFCLDKGLSFQDLQSKYNLCHSAYWLESLDNFIDLLAFYEEKDSDYIHSLPTNGWVIGERLKPLIDEEGDQCGYKFDGYTPKYFPDIHIGYWDDEDVAEYEKRGGDMTHITHGYALYYLGKLSDYCALSINKGRYLLLPSIEGLKKSWAEWVFTSEQECLEAIKLLELEQSKQFEDLCE